MNTANLQHEGIHLAIAAILRLLQDKGILADSEIQTALDQVEDRLIYERTAPGDVSDANINAICFPLRFQKAALRAEGTMSFNAIAAEVHRSKRG